MLAVVLFSERAELAISRRRIYDSSATAGKSEPAFPTARATETFVIVKSSRGIVAARTSSTSAKQIRGKNGRIYRIVYVINSKLIEN